MLEELSRPVMQLTAGSFTGVCVYIMLVQHPVRMALAPAPALADFRAVIPRAEKVQAPLLIVCLLAVGFHLTRSPSWPVAAGGLLMAAVLVLTVATVLPINRRLLTGEAADHVPHARRALARWGQLHTLRTVVTALGAVLLWW